MLRTVHGLAGRARLGRASRQRRAGFTMVELVIALTVGGLLMAFATPKLRSIRDRNNLRAAKNQLSAMLSTARASAIQKGRAARFHVAVDSVYVTVDTTAATGAPALTVVAKRRLKTEFNATLKVRTAADTVVPFDARGFASTRSQQTAIYVVTVPGAGSDSLCVTRYGLIAKRECLQ